MKIGFYFLIFLGLISVFFPSCSSPVAVDPGTLISMENPDSLYTETDSIQVIIKYGDKTLELYSGASGSVGFHGPYTKLVHDYNGGPVELIIIQYDSTGLILYASSVSYNPIEGGKLEKDTVIVLDSLIEFVKPTVQSAFLLDSLYIKNDSASNYGALRIYGYNEKQQLITLQVYNGDFNTLSGVSASVTLLSTYNRYGKEHTHLSVTGGESVDSVFAYTITGLLKEVTVTRQSNVEKDIFTYSGSTLTQSAHYSNSTPTRVVRHEVDAVTGRPQVDSVFTISDGKQLTTIIKYLYTDSLLVSVQFYEREGVELYRSQEFTYNTQGRLITTSTYLEGGARVLSESMSISYDANGNHNTAITTDGDSVIISYYKYVYKSVSPANLLAKVMSGAPYADLTSILNRLAYWSLAGNHTEAGR